LTKSGLLPRGVSVCRDAEDCLERALAALRRGLPVQAVAWTERALCALENAVDIGSNHNTQQEDSKC